MTEDRNLVVSYFDPGSSMEIHYQVTFSCIDAVESTSKVDLCFYKNGPHTLRKRNSDAYFVWKFIHWYRRLYRWCVGRLKNNCDMFKLR